MIRAINAFQIVALFAACPTIIRIVARAPEFPLQSFAVFVMCVCYMVLFYLGFVMAADAFERWK